MPTWAVVRALNRLECALETMRHALESLAVVAPDWLRAHAEPDWAEHYWHRAMDDRLAKNAAAEGSAPGPSAGMATRSWLRPSTR